MQGSRSWPSLPSRLHTRPAPRGRTQPSLSCPAQQQKLAEPPLLSPPLTGASPSHVAGLSLSCPAWHARSWFNPRFPSPVLARPNQPSLLRTAGAVPAPPFPLLVLTRPAAQQKPVQPPFPLPAPHTGPIPRGRAQASPMQWQKPAKPPVLPTGTSQACPMQQDLAQPSPSHPIPPHMTAKAS